MLRALAQPGAPSHLRGLAAAAGVESGNAHKALKSLVEAGIVEAIPDARGTTYRLSEQSPFARPLKLLLRAGSELVQDLAAAAARLDADYVGVFGSAATGKDRPDSDVDVLVIGSESPINAQAAFAPVSRRHHREIDVITIEPAELRKQQATGSAFWANVLGGDLIELKGGDIHAAFGG